MAIRYAGDIFYRPLRTKEHRTKKREPQYKGTYKGIPRLSMPGQKAAQKYFRENPRQKDKVEQAFVKTPPRAGSFSFFMR